MNRILRRPMFRTGGSAEGITSGLAPRQGYKDPGLVEQLTTQKSIIDALAPRQPRQDRSMSNFLIDFGLDIASRPPSGGIFATAAAAAKDPFANFQKAKQIEQAYGAQETEADRALIADMIKGMDDDKLSALMKDVKAGVEAGEFATEAEGIKLLLRKKIYGVLPMEGEAENARIREIELMISRDQEVPAGMINSVAQHIYKIETNAYPEDVQVDLNRTKTFIKPKHIAGVKKDEDGEIIEIVLDPKQAPPRTYNVGQIYFEPQTGELFKNVSKQGEAPRFVKVIFE
tara:strand:+ start:980 stop:1840 length:861 start_codon:yes stop_codon:yes gene_type:complete